MRYFICCLLLLSLQGKTALSNPVITFAKKDWSVNVEGELLAGKPFIIEYDNERLPYCRQTYNGSPVWNIMAFVKFSSTLSGSGAQIPHKVVSMEDQVVFDIPQDANWMKIWFVNSGRGCQSYFDSNFGKNFLFTIR